MVCHCNTPGMCKCPVSWRGYNITIRCLVVMIFQGANPRPETLSKLHTFIMSCGEENPLGPPVKNECMIGPSNMSCMFLLPILGIYWNTCSHSQWIMCFSGVLQRPVRYSQINVSKILNITGGCATPKSTDEWIYWTTFNQFLSTVRRELGLRVYRVQETGLSWIRWVIQRCLVNMCPRGPSIIRRNR